ncbi:uncharacterized protein N7446_010778 [Penicillium canescens]|uniref:PNPLA domain-containing protein n=1 Tax=Penicillium canescens TaxID=5083 RepID=A0AAD6IB93_PENCN|nr:uncharacterized protein N7446_010778 [Penicillium canescens]KAJ6041330.1 hypothetical protein N7460_006720 [Penicillium canescens]KAJ6050669.1 hypothetical protein N7446_010778 [Penicillium canescens]KAJ6065890.1 hypothetical protein N7444_001543 [Penicillium canescens]
MRVRFRPLQCGFRIVTIDGGGVYGISPLVMWKYVLLGLPFGLRLSDYVDLKVATSSGSIVGAGLVIQEMEPDECIDMFTNTAGKVFQDNAACTFLFSVTFYRKILRQWLYGAKYSRDCLLSALQGIFGCEQLLKAAADPKSVNNVRLAFTMTNLMTELYLRRNYDDVTVGAHGDAIYNDDGNIKLVDALGDACAAPTLFEPNNDRQDGAFAANNPSGVALAELNRLSLSSRRMLDFSISFGTGRFVQEDLQPSPNCFSWLCPQWIPRLGRSVLESFSASRNYQRLQEQLTVQERSKHHRLDPLFVGRPIPLDAGKAVEEIKHLTEEFIKHGLDDQVVQDVRLALVATGFYAVARSSPTFDGLTGVYSLNIAIVSRWNDDAKASFKLRNYLRYARFFVQVTARTLDTIMDAQLQPSNSKPHNINSET